MTRQEDLFLDGMSEGLEIIGAFVAGMRRLSNGDAAKVLDIVGEEVDSYLQSTRAMRTADEVSP